MTDVEKHLDETVRDQWESPVQWDARKKFILRNWDQHPEDQLVCLSNVWANMEFLGCRYNSVVEQRVKEMAAGMPEVQKPELPQSTADQQDYKRKRNDGGCYGGKRDLKAPGDPPHKRLKHIDLKKMINFKSGGVLGEEGKKKKLFFDGLSEAVRNGWSDNSKDAKHLAAEAAISKLRQTNPVVKPKKSELTEDALARTEVFGSKGAPEAAISKLRQTNPVVKPKKAELTEDALTRTEVPGSKWAGEQQIKETNIGYQMVRKMGWSGGGIGKKGREGITESIKVNVMKRRAGLGTATDRAEKQSAKARPVILNNVQSGGVTTRINSETDAWSNNAKDARILAAEVALSKLRQTYLVVKTKKAELTEDALTRTEVFGYKEAGEEQIKETNIGNDEGREGIAEPIKVNVMERRTALGTTTDLAEEQSITAKAHQVILKYVQSGREDDLVFSPELTSQERGAIHEVAKQYNLQNKSYGKGKKRYLVIGRRSAKDVIAHVQAQFRPGQYKTVVMDGKYEVSLPQSWSWQ
ncbi:NKRF [Branchiostoma lanceolatum]|uniref:NKRF protein n=1 Tax=Branchiostoma lanceolatum TaxID=7740 RepID=A0A8K0A1N4_BRALA|nr:NKRF [Branchiostoma lanceolatum]